MKETVPGKKKRSGQDKSIQDWKEENIQRPQVKSNTQTAKRTSSSAGNTGFRFEEWPDEQESSGKRVVSQTPAPPLPSTWEPEYKAKDRLGSTHQSGKFGSQSEQPAVGGISGASEEPGKTGWTGRQRPGWSTDDLFPRETVEAAMLPETYRSTGKKQVQGAMEKTKAVSPNVGKALLDFPETGQGMSESATGSTHRSGTFIGEERFSPAPQINHAERNTPGIDNPGVLDQYDRDLTALRTEVLDRAAAELTSRAKAMESLADEYNAMRPNLMKPGQMDWSPEEIGEFQQRGFDLRMKAAELSQQAEENRVKAEQERQQYEKQVYERFLREYETYREAEDWAERSIADPVLTTPIREARYAPKLDALGNPIGTDVLDNGYEDILYAMINGDENAFSIQVTADSNSLGTLDHNYLRQMNEEERKLYNYLYDTQSKETANAYLEEITPFLNARQRQEDTGRWRAYATEDPIGTSAFSILTSPAKTISLFGQAADFLDDGKIDQNAAYNWFVYTPSSIRDQVSEMLEDNWGKKGSTFYQIGMKFADFLWGKAVSDGINAIELSILGSGTAADTVIELRDRGVDSTRSFALGAAAGLAEVIAEEVSLKDLLSPKRLADGVIAFFLNRAVFEGSKGVESNILKWATEALYDLLTAQNESQWKQDIREKERQGLSSREAALEVLREKMTQAGIDSIVSAITGFVGQE